MATWQVVREVGLFSYDVLLNPVFNAPNEAILGAVEEYRHRQRLEQSVGSLSVKATSTAARAVGGVTVKSGLAQL
jgi:hypothetical protein